MTLIYIKRYHKAVDLRVKLNHTIYGWVADCQDSVHFSFFLPLHFVSLGVVKNIMCGQPRSLHNQIYVMSVCLLVGAARRCRFFVVVVVVFHVLRDKAPTVVIYVIYKVRSKLYIAKANLCASMSWM